jgi:hypothetical protein
MKRLRFWYYSVKYAVLAWLDARVKWRWVNDACWDAVAAKHSDALDQLTERLRAEIPASPSTKEKR